MHTIDTSHLPVLVIHTIEPMMLADAEAMREAIEGLVKKNEKFSVIMTTDGGDGKNRERGVNSSLMKWIKENKVAFSQLCVCVASVVPNSAMLAFYRPMAKIAGPRMYGCPVEIFVELDEALKWSRSHF